MSPRPPPTISLKHEWKRELGSDHAQRAEAGQLSRNFQSNQPTLNPIRDGSGRPDDMQDGRNTSRSLEINVNSFAKNSVLQTERSDLLFLKTVRVSMLSRLMTERCDLLLLFIQLKHKTALEYVLLMKAIRSTLMMKYFVKEWKIHGCS